MCDSSIDEDSAIGVSSNAVVFESVSIFLINEGEALFVAEDVGEVGFDFSVLVVVCKVEGGDCEIVLEGLIGGVVEVVVRGVVPESAVTVSVVSAS